MKIHCALGACTAFCLTLFWTGCSQPEGEPSSDGTPQEEASSPADTPEDTTQKAAPVPPPAPNTSARSAKVPPPPPSPQPKVTPPPVPSQPVEAAPEVDPDAMVVNVNGESLTEAELAMRTQGMMNAQRMGQLPPEFRERIKKQMADRVIAGFINEQLLLSEAEKNNIALDQEKLDQYLENLKGTLPPDTTLEDALKQNGLTMDRMMEDLNKQLRIQALVDKKKQEIPTASEEKLKADYQQNIQKYTIGESAQARHILLKVDPSADDGTKEAKKQELEGIRKKILDGQDFAALAKEVSDCPSRAQGGDLGEFERGRMVKPFEDAAFNQPVNEVGPIVETQFGYHLIEVTKREEPHTKTFEDVKDDIAMNMKNQQLNDVMTGYLAGLKGAAKIEYADGYEPAPPPPSGPPAAGQAPVGGPPKRAVKVNTPPPPKPPKPPAPPSEDVK